MIYEWMERKEMSQGIIIGMRKEKEVYKTAVKELD